MDEEFFDFSRALQIVREGGVVTRSAWTGSGITIGVVVPEPLSDRPNAMTPFLAV